MSDAGTRQRLSAAVFRVAALGAFVLLALVTGRANAAPRMYRTVGNTVLDPFGQPFLMHGLNRPSLEWQAEGVNLSEEDVQHMANWGANTIRIPTNQDFLLPDSCIANQAYLQHLDKLVRWVNNAGMNALIDLHWNDRGQACPTRSGQQLMADDRSALFWRLLAAHYKDNPHVFFDLYNEPHDISWDCWLHGCTTSEGWHAVGMQTLYDTVRAAGFRNLVIVGGLNWARDLSGVPTHAVQGYGIVYSTHPYNASADPLTLHNDFGSIVDRYPVIAGEFGPFNGHTGVCAPAVAAGLIAYFDAPDGRQSKRIGWLSWAWYAADDPCAFPAVISDWSGDVAPNGVPVKAALQRYRAEARQR